MKIIDDLVTRFKGFIKSLIDRIREFVSPITGSPNKDTPLEDEPKIIKPPKKTEKHHVAGTSFRLADIEGLLSENAAFYWSKKELVDAGYIEERVYKIGPYYGTAELVPEPENPHDPKAIKVMVAGVHVGYIKAGSCAHIHKLIREERLKKIEVEIKGGDYKIVFENYDDYTEKSTYSLERDSFPFSAVLIITLE